MAMTTGFWDIPGLARFSTVFIASLIISAPTQGASLQEVYRLAYENDPKYRATVAETQASSTALDQARAGFLPTVKYDIESWETRQRIYSSQNPIFGAGVTNFPTDNRTLSLNQPIFRMDVITRFSQAKSVVKQAEYTLLAAEQDLMLRTTSAYLTVLAASDSVALAVAEREALGKALDLARERLKMGLGTVTNQHDATARHAVAQAREVEAQNKLRDARQALREITGNLINDLKTLRDDIPLESPDPNNVDRWVQSALDQNLILRAKNEAVDVARQEVERQKAGYYPSLNFLVNNNRRDSGSTLFGGGSDVETTDMIFRLSIPIFEGGLTRAVTKEAAYRYQKSKEEYEQEHRSVERVTRAAYDGTLGGVNLVKALGQAVISQQSALDTKLEGFKSGLFALLPVLDAHRDLYLAKRDYAQSRYEYLIYRLRLKQAAGTLSEADLVGIGSLLR